MNFVLAALLSNLSYALGDNINGFLSKRNSPIKINFWSSIFGALIYLAPAIVFFRHDFTKVDTSALIWIVTTGILLELGYMCFLMGMRRGSVVLTGVIGGSFPVVTTIVALIFFNERLTGAEVLAILVVLAGIMLSSMHGSLKETFGHIRKSALIYAFLSFLLFGISFAIIRVPIEKVGWFVPQYASNLIGIILSLMFAYAIKEKGFLSVPKTSPLMAINAVIGLGGTILYSYAISRGQTSIVAPIAGSSPAVFAILAYIFFKERLTRLQEVGVVVTLAGIISLSLLSG